MVLDRFNPHRPNRDRVKPLNLININETSNFNLDFNLFIFKFLRKYLYFRFIIIFN